MKKREKGQKKYQERKKENKEKKVRRCAEEYY